MSFTGFANSTGLYVDLGTGIDHSTSGLSLVAWVYRDATGWNETTADVVVSIATTAGDNTGTVALTVCDGAADRVWARSQDDGDAVDVSPVTGSTDEWNGQWIPVVLTLSAAEVLQLSVESSSTQGAANSDAKTFASNFRYVYIGTSAAGFEALGKNNDYVSDVAIFDKALSDAEIDNLQVSDGVGPVVDSIVTDGSCVAYWHLRGSDETAARVDQTGNGHTLGNQATAPNYVNDTPDWTIQGWRHSLAGIPDPENETEQWRYSLARTVQPEGGENPEILPGVTGTVGATLGGVSVSFVGTFTAYVHDFTLTERMSLVSLPEPTDGLTWSTRMALANYPGVNLADDPNVAGSLNATLGGLTVALAGTFEGSDVDGSITTTLGGLDVGLTGEYVDRLYFNVEYGVTPIFTATEYPAIFGSLSPTLGGITVDFAGYSLPADSNQGLITTLLGGITPDFVGTSALPPTYSGQLATTLSSLSVGFTGSSVPAGSNQGLITTTLGGITVDLAGTFEKWSTDGALNIALGGITPDIQGISVTSDVVFGVVDTVLSGITVSLRGETSAQTGSEDAYAQSARPAGVGVGGPL